MGKSANFGGFAAPFYRPPLFCLKTVANISNQNNRLPQSSPSMGASIFQGFRRQNFSGGEAKDVASVATLNALKQKVCVAFGF